MPPRTAKLRPIIVYVPDEDYDELEHRARESAASLSQIVRAILHAALNGN